MVSVMSETTTNQVREKEAEVTSTFKDFRVRDNGAWLLKFKIPMTEMGRAASVLIFVGRKFRMNLSVLNENGIPTENLPVGVLKFDSLHFSTGGNSTLTVLGERLGDMNMEAHEIQKLLEQSMVLSLREVFPQ